MIHASVELVDAVGGVSPYMATRFGRTLREEAFGFRACDGAKQTGGIGGLAHASTTFTDAEPPEVVDCPACLLLMRSADPVRWDACEERGLNPKLETK